MIINSLIDTGILDQSVGIRLTEILEQYLETENHLKLQEKPALIACTEFSEERQWIKDLWQRVLEWYRWNIRSLGRSRVAESLELLSFKSPGGELQMSTLNEIVIVIGSFHRREAEIMLETALETAAANRLKVAD